MKYICMLMLVLAAQFALAQDFPASFVGHWEGELQWFQAGREGARKEKMQLVILPLDTPGHYTWQIIYGENNRDNRPYVLKPAGDSARGHWVIDEKNGIVLDQYWLGNRLTGVFSIQKSVILNAYYREGNHLVIEYFSHGTEPSNTTGGTSEQIPPVNNFQVRSYQKAILRKKD